MPKAAIRLILSIFRLKPKVAIRLIVYVFHLTPEVAIWLVLFLFHLTPEVAIRFIFHAFRLKPEVAIQDFLLFSPDVRSDYTTFSSVFAERQKRLYDSCSLFFV